MWCICPSSLSSLFVEKQVFGSGCSYFTVPKLWFLMEHHAMNISLKNRKCKFRKVLWKRKVRHVHVSNLYTPAVSGHTLVAAVLFVPVVALYGRIVAARPRTHAPHSRSITGSIHLHLILKKKWAQIWVSLISVMGIFCILMKACHIRWSCYTSLSFRMRLYDTVKAKVRMKTIQPLGIVSGLTTWNQLV